MRVDCSKCKCKEDAVVSTLSPPNAFECDESATKFDELRAMCLAASLYAKLRQYRLTSLLPARFNDNGRRGAARPGTTADGRGRRRRTTEIEVVGGSERAPRDTACGIV